MKQKRKQYLKTEWWEWWDALGLAALILIFAIVITGAVYGTITT